MVCDTLDGGLVVSVDALDVVLVLYDFVKHTYIIVSTFFEG